MKKKLWFKRIKHFLKRNKSNILFGLSIGGTVAADVLFIYEGKKLYKDNAKPDAGSYIKAYWLPVTVSALSVGAGVCSHNALAAEKLALASLAGFTTERYNNLKNKTSEEDILEADSKTLEDLIIEADAANELYDDVESPKHLYYLPQYGIAFMADEETVSTAELNLNMLFTHEMEASLGDFLDFIGIEDPKWQSLGNSIGWRFNYDDIDDGIQYISFTQYQKPLQDGTMCMYIYFNVEAQTWKQWDEEYQDIEYK
ncbi:DUF6353 family protein [Lachnoclostridium sp. Marseille-P6806]|uniref:DUF6353 family protein n=1 Tax=Lachnoclostridium sp. Marseille-P6806 TaxID=2364793 RepID=UPI00103084E7|nr:DUF6353 family protein [Lachnoclostridium sp. Marseille-P6806]